MRNKVKLKKLLLSFSIILCLLVLVFLTINIYQYNTYNENTNKKLSSIINLIEEKYPNISENEIMDILYSNEEKVDILIKYNIDIRKDSLIQDNDSSYKMFILVNTIFYFITVILMLLYFLRFNYKKDKEINKITKCIEEINRKNYKLELDDMSEDELSILKNEIYKTTITLKEAAENSNKDKLQLKDSLSDISHQLKTPLTSILIALDNLIDDPDMNKEIREDFIKDIRRETSNISFLVQSILKLSKIDTNTIEFNYQEVSLLEIVNEVKKNLSMLCDLKNIKIDINVKSLIKIKCDYKWQVEALSNIVKNSIEHSKENDIVGIEANSNKIYSQIIVKDNGCGINKEDLPHIFERFYKCKNSTKDSIGIGLALSKSIIEKSNGKISVESNENGTTFTIIYYK